MDLKLFFNLFYYCFMKIVAIAAWLAGTSCFYYAENK